MLAYRQYGEKGNTMTDAAITYDFLGDLYNEIRETDTEELAHTCGVDRSIIDKDLKQTLRMIDEVRSLVAHRF